MKLIVHYWGKGTNDRLWLFIKIQYMYNNTDSLTSESEKLHVTRKPNEYFHSKIYHELYLQDLHYVLMYYYTKVCNVLIMR